MKRQEFTVVFEGKEYNCYIDEYGRVFIAGDPKDILAASASAKISTIEEAQRFAKLMIEAICRNKQKK